ncbi:alpha-L-glutamate ligase [Microbacteriaceae bacterium VKM Ac-2854]|nr:alpha-L-glutamate ligase [Microbacteriaceae bacterium VKM Ac-2854]
MILVVSYPEEDHTAAVVDLLRADGHEVELLDAAQLPTTDSIELEYGVDGCAHRLRIGTDGPDRVVDLDAARAGWWRRIRALAPHPSITDPAAAGFAVGETVEVFEGLIGSLNLDWINDPVRDREAHHKPLQWTVAHGLGFDLPRTLVTSSPERARDFVAELGVGQVIAKPFLERVDAWRETRILDHNDVERLDQVRLAPTLLQEYVPGVDLRVTVVGHHVYATEIDASATSYPADMRMVLGEAEVHPVLLPEALVTRIRALLSRLGLVYGAVDLRRTPDGGYRFFEVNPAGLWLFAQQRSGWPITEAVAGELAKRERMLVPA